VSSRVGGSDLETESPIQKFGMVGIEADDPLSISEQVEL
jgi:hypothetical protein